MIPLKKKKEKKNVNPTSVRVVVEREDYEGGKGGGRELLETEKNS